MAHFETALEQRQVGRDRWMTLKPLIYVSDVAKRRIVVPANFSYDGASVPRIPVAFWLTGGRAWAPACLHDFGYQHPDEEDRALWDAMFAEAMGVHQPELGHYAEPEWVRMLMYFGVRVAGWLAWRNYRARAEALNPVWTMTDTWPTASEETS